MLTLLGFGVVFLRYRSNSFLLSSSASLLQCLVSQLQCITCSLSIHNRTMVGQKQPVYVLGVGMTKVESNGAWRG